MFDSCAVAFTGAIPSRSAYIVVNAVHTRLNYLAFRVAPAGRFQGEEK